MGTWVRKTGVLALCLLVVIAGSTATATVPTANGEAVAPPAENVTGSAQSTLVVAQDGSGDYQSIQAAIDAAQPGDTVEIRPGNYSERLTIDKSITVTAPQGALISGAPLDASNPTAIRIPPGSDASPTLRNLNVSEQWGAGINATATDGDITLDNVTVIGGFYGVSFGEADGTWRIEDSLIGGGLLGSLFAPNTTADWTVNDSVMFGSLTFGVTTAGSTGDWTIRNSVVNTSAIGVFAAATSGAWTMDNVSVGSVVSIAVDAQRSTGDWTIRDSTVGRINASLFGQFSPNSSGVGIRANDTDGAWTVTNTALTGIPNASINATGASIEGDARGNWWGQASGPEPGDCLGNVDCGDPLSEPPAGSNQLTLPGQRKPAGNLDGDPLLEDVDGDGSGTLFDALAYYNNRRSSVIQNNPRRFDFDGDGTPGRLFDALALYNEISG